MTTVLGKVKDFLGVISEANRQLEQDAKDNSHKYDIEALTGNESEVIEMDLMLGIADLHTPEAVAAAESATDHGQLVIPASASSSETESEGTSDDDDEENATDSDFGAADDFNNGNNDDNRTWSSLRDKVSKCGQDSSSKAPGSNRPKKRPKIVEMS
uniref:Uncharacterized protein MANES_10G087700 n=1 Tax=Rhizophora mucronata TaxID=61149 RepID=A0A2P2J8M6_RHIMU